MLINKIFRKCMTRRSKILLSCRRKTFHALFWDLIERRARFKLKGKVVYPESYRRSRVTVTTRLCSSGRFWRP